MSPRTMAGGRTEALTHTSTHALTHAPTDTPTQWANAVIAAGPLRLAPPTPADAAQVYASARESMASVGRWMPWCTPQMTEADMLAWVQACQRDRASSGAGLAASYEFCIWDTASDTHLGNCGLNRIDALNRCANLGYWVRESAQGRGVARSAAQALARWAFEVLGLRRIEIMTAVGNSRSAAVARAVGAQHEAVLRRRLFLSGSGHNVDADLFCLLAASGNHT